jgi:transposase
MERRKRRSFTPEFKAEAVRQVREGGKSMPQVAKELDLTESALRNWVREAEGDEGKEPAAGVLSTAEREELMRLRKENRQLQMERDFLKKLRWQIRPDLCGVVGVETREVVPWPAPRATRRQASRWDWRTAGGSARHAAVQPERTTGRAATS